MAIEAIDHFYQTSQWTKKDALKPCHKRCNGIQCRYKLFTGEGPMGYWAIYGNTILRRVKCPYCKLYSICVQGVTQCCAAHVDEFPHRSKMISQPRDRRKQPPVWLKKEILIEQDNRCFYCESPFTSWYVKGDGHPIKLRLNWDHITPFEYTMNNNNDNFVAACHLCNTIKGRRIFETIEEAKNWLRLQQLLPPSRRF